MILLGYVNHILDVAGYSYSVQRIILVTPSSEQGRRCIELQYGVLGCIQQSTSDQFFNAA